MSTDNSQPTMGDQAVVNALYPAPSDVPADLSNRTAPDMSNQAMDPQGNDATPVPAAAPSGKPSLWRAVLAGALNGLQAGAQTNTRGMSGSSAFVAGAGAGANQVLNVVPQQQRAAQIQQTQLDNEKLQTAYHYAQLSQIQKQIHLMPDDKQEQYLSQAADDASAMLKSGATVPASDASDLLTAQKQLQALHARNSWAVYSLAPIHGADGSMQYQVVQFPKAPIQKDLTLAGAGDDGSDMVIPAGTPADKVGQYYTNYLNKKLSSDLEDKKQQGRMELQQSKNDAAHARENGKNSGLWVPGVSADEKKKAELAENIAFNSGEVARLLIRRPDLVGAVAGRFTNIEQMIGNNDSDISALGTHIHNIAMANSGVHGFRSQEGVKSYEQQLLNNFKNGPQAIAGALKASTTSVQTFIDNARPETYRTHSKRGGAVRGMQDQGVTNGQ